MSLFLVDSHCHLDFPDFSEERDAIVERAGAAGIGTILTISTRVARIESLIALTEAYPGVYATVGTHPNSAAEEPDVLTAELVRWAERSKIVGIGEAGLDYFYDKASPEVQTSVFLRHIAAARETGLPLVIHARDADDDMRRILEAETEKGAFPFILHCFSSGPALAETGIALGGTVSFSGILTFKKSDALREIAASVPLDRLLVETDAPYLAPMPNRGKRNEPAYVRQTAEVLAAVKGVDLDTLAAATSDNFFRLFSKVPDPRRTKAAA
ncbi:MULTISPECIES: TatD family hydrolase [unclassified Aureimonas]|uniref:TatD family hydrolase n=1 Tax=unclassified Aureimonas TaxID=2615206 RepID=UPI0006FBDD4D|nr:MULTISPECIES: TatD family hydrolase [unclassified Aureimonas]KQT60349.1 LuxR family transcriptional regulator [Aureimonas sp. Leaf427]KQT79225.1 LuxR family transcriptional regulator [Aureimonas sp. Leaf460]